LKVCRRFSSKLCNAEFQSSALIAPAGLPRFSKTDDGGGFSGLEMLKP
jgi:hypothetical protein